MPEFNLLEKAGMPQRKKRKREPPITKEDKVIAAKLDFGFYDGERKKGYGGYYYDGRWRKVAEIIKERYKLNKNSRVLIDRCHKGFLVFDLKKLIQGIEVCGIPPSEYALNHAMEGYGRWALIHGLEKNEDPKFIEGKARQEIIPYLIKGNSNNMPFKDNYFDTVISIENACSYPLEQCKQVIREITRVSKNNGKNCYIQNDSWTNSKEREKLMNWTFLCKTFLDIKGWEKLYKKERYEGDWGFTIIE